MRHLILLMALAFAPLSHAAETFGKIHDIAGSAQITDAGTAAEASLAQQVSVGQAVHVGQTISTGPDGELHITSTDGGLIALRPNTVFRVDAYIAEHKPT